MPHGVDVKSLAPYMEKVTSAVPRYTMKQLRERFWGYDSNKDGRLSRKELQAAFKHLGARVPRWKARRALNHADGNGDGYISEEEIDDVVNYAVKSGYVVVVE